MKLRPFLSPTEKCHTLPAAGFPSLPQLWQPPLLLSASLGFFRMAWLCPGVTHAATWATTSFWLLSPDRHLVIIPTLRLLWILLLWTSRHTLMYGCVFSFLLDAYPEFLGYMIIPGLTCWGISDYFPNWLHQCTFATTVCGVKIAPLP